MGSDTTRCALCGFEAHAQDAFCALCGAVLKGAAAPVLQARPAAPAAPAAGGRLRMPDGSALPLREAPAVIGRERLEAFAEAGRRGQLSREHLTAYARGGRCFIEDGPTGVQRKPSTNGTWLVRGPGAPEERITGKGPVELRGGELVVLARAVTLRFEAGEA